MSERCELTMTTMTRRSRTSPVWDQDTHRLAIVPILVSIMTTCRIDFKGQQGGVCVSEPVRISRVQPAAMTNHMSSSAWTNFCDKVDDALQPLDQIKRLSRTGTIVFFVLIIVFMIAPFTWLSTSSSSNPWEQPSLSGSFWAFLIGPLVLMGGMICMQCLAAQKSRDVIKDVEAVCEDISKQYSALSFHIRFEYMVYGRYGGYNNTTNTHYRNRTSTMTTNYIEVSIADAEVPTAVPTFGLDTNNIATPSAPPIVTASMVGEKSAADRLRDLDEMRGMLTQEEYDRKRQEILDSV